MYFKESLITDSETSTMDTKERRLCIYCLKLMCDWECSTAAVCGIRGLVSSAAVTHKLDEGYLAFEPDAEMLFKLRRTLICVQTPSDMVGKQRSTRIIVYSIPKTRCSPTHSSTGHSLLNCMHLSKHKQYMIKKRNLGTPTHPSVLLTPALFSNSNPKNAAGASLLTKFYTTQDTSNLILH